MRPKVEHHVTPAEAFAMVTTQFPDLAPVRVHALGEGWDNTAYRVNRDWVFRFPRRVEGARCLESEIRVMPHVAGRLPLPVAAPERVGEPTAAFPYRFAGHRWIEGTTACTVDLPDAVRTEFAEPLGEFLRALHAIDADEAREMGARDDDLHRTNVGVRAGRALERFDQLEQSGLLASAKPWREIVRSTPATSTDRPRCLVHGDLYARHLAVDESGLTGILDWGDVHCGDRAVDLAIAWLFLPTAARETFRAAYGPLDDDTWQLARFRATYHSAAVLGYAAEVEDASLFRETRRALDRLLE